MGLLHEPRRLTRIMYGANLSYAQVRVYLPLLESAGLVRQEVDMWIITDRGRTYLSLFRELTELAEPARDGARHEINLPEQIS